MTNLRRTSGRNGDTRFAACAHPLVRLNRLAPRASFVIICAMSRKWTAETALVIDDASIMANAISRDLHRLDAFGTVRKADSVDASLCQGSCRLRRVAV